MIPFDKGVCLISIAILSPLLLNAERVPTQEYTSAISQAKSEKISVLQQVGAPVSLPVCISGTVSYTQGLFSELIGPGSTSGIIGVAGEENSNLMRFNVAEKTLSFRRIPLSGNSRLEVFDEAGRVKLSMLLTSPESISLGNLPAGVYIATLSENSTNLQTLKLILK